MSKPDIHSYVLPCDAVSDAAVDLTVLGDMLHHIADQHHHLSLKDICNWTDAETVRRFVTAIYEVVRESGYAPDWRLREGED